MGGKTQQRVAGNAKPTNSGRIRGLLINQQLATNKVITFSALSSKSQEPTKSKPETPVVEEAAKSNSSPGEAEKPTISLSNVDASPISKPCPQPETQTPTKDVGSATKLVLKKVGNRELYVRVKVTDDESFQGSAVELSQKGVKKPAYLEENKSIDKSSETKQVDDDDDDDEKSEALEEDKQDENEADDDPDDKLQFDELLDQVDQTRALTEQSKKIGNLQELDPEMSEHETRLLKTFRLLLRKFSGDLSIEDWDIIVNSLNKWIGWISNANHPLRESHQANFSAKVFEFIHQLIVYAERLQQEVGDQDNNPMMQSLLDDWANFRSSSMFLDLIGLYLKLTTHEKSQPQQVSESSSILSPMIEALAHVIISVDPRVVLSHHKLLDYIDARVEFDSEFKTPKNSIFCKLDEKKFSSFMAVCGLLKSNSRVNLVTAHAILNKVLGPVCENAQSATLIADQEAVDDILIFPPVAIMSVLTSRDSIVATLLSDYRVGDISVTMDPSTDAYACTLSYLFVWDLAIQFINGVDKEIGQCMIHSMKKLGLLQRLLDTIFMLLPPLDDKSSLHFRFESSDGKAAEETQSWCIKQFLKAPLSTTIKRPANEIELVALHLYFSVALHMPVTVRKWYNNNSNKRLCNLVNEYTVKHISQLICSIEMDSVQEKCQERVYRDESNNLTIKARPTAKEVYAMYLRDEFKMELTIKLPLNYPLGSVQIDGGKRVGVTDVKWRSWLLQLTTFLAHQNGPILDGIDLWRKNIDKRFEGVEKCTICFSILHSNYQLPKKRCQTCANMFHNVCLYKWFESSGNSTCPLCRNPW